MKGLACHKGSGSSIKGRKGRRVSLRSSQSSWMMLLSGKDRKPGLLPVRCVQEGNTSGTKGQF